MSLTNQPSNYTTKRHQYDITQYPHVGWAAALFRGSHERSRSCRQEDAEDAGSSVRSRLEQLIKRHERSAGFCGSPNFALNHLSDGYPPSQCLIDVLAGHTDHLSPSARRVEARLCKPAIADENARRSGSLLIELALKRMKLSCANRISDPFGFYQIRFVSKLKASVYPQKVLLRGLSPVSLATTLLLNQASRIVGFNLGTSSARIWVNISSPKERLLPSLLIESKCPLI